MVDILLCHSETTSDLADRIAARLERGAEAKVWKEEISSSFSLFDACGAGVTSAGVLIILSSDAVPPKLDRGQWETILAYSSKGSQPSIACVKATDCRYPGLLERKNFFEWQKDPVDALRCIEQWAIHLHFTEGQAKKIASLPAFILREDEMRRLYSRLVDTVGTAATLLGPPASGKSVLAQQFAHRAGGHFRDVVWIPCGESSDALILANLASQLDVSTAPAITALLQEHRLLLVFDDIRRPLPMSLPDQASCSVLLTTRDTSLNVGEVIQVSAAMTMNTEPPINETLRSLWKSMSVCHSCGVVEDFAAAIADIEQRTADKAIQSLLETGLVDRLDEQRLRMNNASRSLALQESDILQVRERHAHTLLDAFSSESPLREALIAEAPAGIAFVREKDWPLCKDLTLRVCDFLRRRNRNGEAVEILSGTLSEAKRRNDKGAIQDLEWEISWLKDDGELRLQIVAPQQLGLAF